MDRSSPRRRTAVAVLVLALAGGVPVAPSAAAAPAPDAAHPADATGRADGAHPAAGSHPVGAAGASLRARLERARLRPRPPRTAGPPRHLSGPDVGTVTGVVTDAAGRPAAGLLVGAVGAGHDGGGGTAVSDADGRYTVTATAGRYLLSLLTSEELLQYAPAARVPAEAHVYPVRAGRTLRVDVTLLPIGQISGRVTYPDGRPVRHELVVGWQVDGPDVPDETTATDDQGHFALRLFGGRYRLAVAHPEDSGMQFVPGRRRPEEGTVFTVGTDTTAVVTETLRDHGSLHGRITDVTGAPSGGLEVVVEPRGGGVPLTATTGGDGVFQLPRVMHGDYVVRFRPSPHTWWRYLGGGATPDGARTITVSSGRETAVVGSVSGGGRVEVRPLAADGRPVAGFCAAWAEPVEGQQFTRCTDDAALTLDDLPPGPVRITVRPGTPALLLPGQDTATVTRGATVRAAPRLAAGGGVRVAVTARATGAPVGDVSVLLVPAAPGGQPCHLYVEHGGVGDAVMPPGRYRLFVSPAAHPDLGSQWVGRGGGVGTQWDAAEVEVPAGGRAAAPPVRLDPAGAVRGRVTDADGRPAVGAVVSAPAPEPGDLHGGSPQWGRADVEGGYEVTGLGPYPWPLFVVPRRGAMQWAGGVGSSTRAATARPAAGAPAALDIALRPHVTLRGTLTGAGAAPAYVEARHPRTGEPLAAARLRGGRYEAAVLAGARVRLGWLVADADGPRRGWHGGPTFDTAAVVPLPHSGARHVDLHAG